MKSQILAILFFSIGLLPGCTSTSQVSSDSTKSRHTYRSFTEAMQHQTLEAVLEDGTERRVKDVLARPDSIQWYDISTGMLELIATSEVKSIRKVNSIAGAVEGCLLGAAGGAIVTLPFTLPGGGDMKGLGVGLGIFYGGLCGGALGFVYGISNGHTTEYQFMPESLLRSREQQTKR